MPRWIIYVLLVLVAVTLIPIGLIYRSLHQGEKQPRIQVVYDMDQQSYYKAQTENPFFADGMSMRKPPQGTVARGLLNEDDAWFRGIARDTIFVQEIPAQVTTSMLERGRERFDIYCSPCHDRTGSGNGMIVQRGLRRPPSFHIQRLREAPAGYYFDVITNGFGIMLNYRAQVPVDDRWAIIAYIRALQLSQNATIGDVPADQRATLDQGAAGH